PVSASTLVIAAVSVVLPWSTCPIVPTLQCGLFRSNFAFDIAAASHHKRKRLTTLLINNKPLGKPLGAEPGAGDGNRTHVASLEGWSSTIELHPLKLTLRPFASEDRHGLPDRGSIPWSRPEPGAFEPTKRWWRG